MAPLIVGASIGLAAIVAGGLFFLTRNGGGGEEPPVAGGSRGGLAAVETTEPATTESATTEFATTVPATAEPATTEPATTEPATTRPATTRPATTAPATTEPAPTTEPTLAPGEIPPPTEDPAGLGSNAAFDDLAKRCFDGAMFSCDELYTRAGDDAAYQAFADTCAGRQELDTGRYCHELAGFPPPALQADDLPNDDPELINLAIDCRIGDMGACDELFRLVHSESAFHEFADTCAGRRAAGEDAACTVAFPEWAELRETHPS